MRRVYQFHSLFKEDLILADITVFATFPDILSSSSFAAILYIQKRRVLWVRYQFPRGRRLQGDEKARENFAVSKLCNLGRHDLSVRLEQ